MKDGKIITIGMGSGTGTLALLCDGEILCCISEERFNRTKSSMNFPNGVYDYIRKTYGIVPEEIDAVVVDSTHQVGMGFDEKPYVQDPYGGIYMRIGRLEYEYPFLKPVFSFLYNRIYKPFVIGNRRGDYLTKFSRKFGCAAEKIHFIDHHLSHACAALYGYVDTRKDERVIVITLDGGGDNGSGSVSIYENGKLNRVSCIPNDASLGMLYNKTTDYLGLKPHEHEYKVMGLAPYADIDRVKMALPVFESVLKVTDDLNFSSPLDSRSYYFYLKDKLERVRFDYVAGAVQLFAENVMCELAGKAAARFKCGKIVVGGGVFLNVKANKRIGEMAEVERLMVCPSGSDESNAIGTAYYGYELVCAQTGRKFEPKNVENLYLGPSYTNDEVKKAIEAAGCGGKYRISYHENIEAEVARLLAENKIVARAKGRMEFGARALGNRSILANPSHMKNVRVINEQIKERDFWMPFACTVLAERADDYIVNPKKTGSAFMQLSFDTWEEKRDEIQAAIHPYDFTTRPQILSRSHNESYYDLIKHFEKRTGIGAVLNTSFNLHGEPIVNSPADAISVFERSGLRHLALENYLISKE